MNSEKVTAERVEGFLNGQLADWAQARDNYAALNDVVVKEFTLDSLPLKVQFNPARIVSSAAKVDAKSLAARKCFLCDENRPEVQGFIAWGDDYKILVNPFPIFPRHFTIPCVKHTPQRIAGRVADMVSLAADMKGYTVFYNGPKCGASAPDHMHFQAGNSDFLTLPGYLVNADLQPIVVDPDGEAVLSVCEGLPFGVFVIDTTDAATAQKLFDRLYAAMPVAEGEEEPMMNLLCYVTEEQESRLVVIPRKRHRPSFYGTEGADCMLISPASVDMGGAFIVPRREDFDRLDAETVKRIYSELCLDEEEMNTIIEKL